MDNKLYFCIEFLHVKPGKGNTFMRTARNLKTYAWSVALISSSTKRLATISS